MNRKSLLVLLISLLVSMLAIHSLSSASWAGVKIETLIGELRKDLYENETEFDGQTLYMGGFGITYQEASDFQLSQFLKINSNQEWIEATLQQNWFGQGLQLWITYQKNLIHEEQIAAPIKLMDLLLKESVLASFNRLSAIGGLFFLNPTVTAISTLSALLQGVNAIIKFTSYAEKGYWGQELLKTYVTERKNTEPNALFDKLYNSIEYSDCYVAINTIFGIKHLKPLSEQDKRTFAIQYLEYRFQSWKLATEPERREAIKKYILDNIPPPLVDAGPDQTVGVGAMVQLNGTAFCDPGVTPKYRWHFIIPDRNKPKLSDPKIADPTFTADQEGIYLLQLEVWCGRLADSDSVLITASAPVPVLSSITITPGIAALTVGDTQQFTATAFDQFNNPMVPQPTFTWASSNTAIGTVNSAGLFGALSAGGPINVTASVGSVSGNASVTVSAPAPILTSIGVNPATVTVTLGSTQQFTATTVDQYGNPIIPQPSFTWTSSDASIGTIDTTGLFTGVSVGGPITITASVGPISGSASVTVSALPPPPPPGGPWPMFQHDAQHTGRSPFVGPANLTNPTVGVFLMGEAANDYFKPPAIGSDGTIYLGARITNGGISREGVYAFAFDGTQKWFYQTSYPQGTPALSETDGLVYIPSLQGLLAIDIQTGNLKWKKDFAYLDLSQNPVMADDGSLYFISGCIVPDGTFNSCLVSFNMDGEVKWIYAIEKNETYYDQDLPEDCPTGASSSGPSNPTIDKDGTIYFGYSDTLFAINPDGTEKWRRVFPVFSTGGWNYPSQQDSKSAVLAPSIGSDGTVYLTAASEKYDTFEWDWYDCVHAIDPQNHLTDKWPKSCSAYGSSLFAIGPDGTLYNTHLFWGRYAWNPDQYLKAIDHSSGQVKWGKFLGFYSGAIQPIVDAQGNIYTSNTSNQIIAFDQDGNQKAWAFSLADRSGFLSLDEDGTLFIPGQTYLYIIGP